jgi:hypothetical protein
MVPLTVKVTELVPVQCMVMTKFAPTLGVSAQTLATGQRLVK